MIIAIYPFIWFWFLPSPAKRYNFAVESMVLILDGNSLISRCARMEQFLLFICLRHLIRLRAITNLMFFYPKRPIFHHACATFNELPSNISTMQCIRMRSTTSISFSMIIIKPLALSMEKYGHNHKITKI